MQVESLENKIESAENHDKIIGVSLLLTGKK
jgi:hypothetical protein